MSSPAVSTFFGNREVRPRPVISTTIKATMMEVELQGKKCQLLRDDDDWVWAMGYL